MTPRTAIWIRPGHAIPTSSMDPSCRPTQTRRAEAR